MLFFTLAQIFPKQKGSAPPHLLKHHTPERRYAHSVNPRGRRKTYLLYPILHPNFRPNHFQISLEQRLVEPQNIST